MNSPNAQNNIKAAESLSSVIICRERSMIEVHAIVSDCCIFHTPSSLLLWYSFLLSTIEAYIQSAMETIYMNSLYFFSNSSILKSSTIVVNRWSLTSWSPLIADDLNSNASKRESSRVEL